MKMRYNINFSPALLYLIITLLFSNNLFSQIFTKVTSGSFVNDGGASRSVNFIDYDGDGDLDLFVSNGKLFGQFNFLYRNDAGYYIRLTNFAITQDSLPYDGSSWADFDNDGDLDLCVVNWYDSTNMLYRNDGSNFVLLANSPVVTNRGFSETCSWGDFNNDGLVDLFVTNSAGSPRRNWLYRNNGNGDFTRIDSGVIFNDIGYESRGVNWVDIDGDRDLDLFVCNESGQNELMYRNDGGGFSKITSNTPVSSGGNSWSSSWGDYDNDGDLDLFVANWGNQKNKLFKNEDNFNFTDITGDTIVNDNGYYACSGWGDYDNDGDLDMFVTQSYRTPNSPLKNNLYKNKLMETGLSEFEKVSGEDIVNDAGYSYGFAWADFDSDGDLDVFVSKTYNEAENNACYLNNGNSNKWIEVKCTGTTTNRSAIGTKVRLKALINNLPVWQVREIDAQSGYCGETLDLHFGLGNASVIDSVKVEWPSGTTQYFTEVQVNQVIRIDEFQGIIGFTKINDIYPKEFNLYQNYPNPFNPVTKIKFEVPAAWSQYNEPIRLSIYDVKGCEISTLTMGELKPGTYEFEWNASGYSSGFYFYKLTGMFTGFSNTKKMILMK